ncbi:hypothetical protein A8M77_09620 [Variovorax sp. JS1663]|nr:hypothetical protein A8M77_09620 [Variovorax sp. JS1663]
MRLQTWTTEGVPAAERPARFAEVCARTLLAQAVQAGAGRPFEATLEQVDLGPISIVNLRGSPWQAHRGLAQIARDPQRSFHLLLCRNVPWRLVHRGEIRLAPGDAVLIDSFLAHDIELGASHDLVHIGIAESWIRQWIADPGALAGRPLRADDRWSRALTSYLSALSPGFVARAPLPPKVIVDQVGVMLALAAEDHGFACASPGAAQAPLEDRIVECIVHRCNDPALTASAVARALDISIRTLHRALASAGKTFGATLVTARAQTALRMLESSRFSRLTVAEIGRRAGFSDASHFTRAFSRSYGRTPSMARCATAA